MLSVLHRTVLMTQLLKRNTEYHESTLLSAENLALMYVGGWRRDSKRLIKQT